MKHYLSKGVFSRALLLAFFIANVFSQFGVFSPGAKAAAIIEQENNQIRVEENRSIILRLDATPTNVFIAEPGIADVSIKSQKLLYIFGKTAGVTTFYAVDANDNIIYSATIEVDFNIERIQKMMDELLPQASISIKQMNGILILTGHAKSPEEADLAGQLVQQISTSRQGGNLTIINRIEVNTPTQVNLRVKIAEMSRDVMKDLGFNWDISLLGKNGASFFGFSKGAEFVNRVLDDMGNETLGLRTFERGSDNSFIFNNIGGRHDVNTIIDALEEEGYLTVLAEPNLTALSGETASFLAGGEFPIPIAQGGSSSNAITVQFKQFGVGLTFVPTVLSEDKINLKVAPEVSQLSSAGSVTFNDISIPALTTRKVNTTIELGSGQSFALAGLLQSNISQEVSKYPILGDIPILGTLFRSDSFKREETELVVIVTPYIVRPANPGQLITPADLNYMPQDTGRWIKGKRDLAGDGGLSTGEGG